MMTANGTAAVGIARAFLAALLVPAAPAGARARTAMAGSARGVRLARVRTTGARSDTAAPTAGARAAAYCRSFARDTSGFRPQREPTLEVHRATGPIRLDGTLDDPGWRDVDPATRFTEFIPDEDVPATVGNLAFVTYDQEKLYVALVACDDPSTLRATFADRDQIEGDDIFGIFLDTYGNGAWAYELFANPLGIQADWRRVSGQGKDITFDLVYRTAAKVTDHGYQIEFAIPFESLRFPDLARQRWRVTFLRHRPRAAEEEFSWSAIDLRDPCILCQMGTMTGVEGVHPGGALELLPSAVATDASSLRDPDDPGSGFDGGGLDGRLSLGARYSFATGITAEATINPDFSQVESDAAQVDVNTTFALFFPEKRPFFQEGGDLFDTPLEAIYTRSINDPRGAAKFTARSGGTSVAYLAARDQHSPVLLPFEESSFAAQAGKSFTNILRAQEDFAEDSHLGLTFTDRRLDGGPGSSTVFGPDLRLRFTRHLTLEYQLLASHTREPDAAGPTAPLAGTTFDRGAHTAVFDGEGYWGYGQQASLSRGGRYWNAQVEYKALSPTFRAENGFITQNDQRSVEVSASASVYPGAAAIVRAGPQVEAVRTWNFAGRRKLESVSPSLSASLAGLTSVQIGGYLADERFRGVDLRGIGRVDFFAETRFTELLSMGGGVSVGEFVARRLAAPVVGQGTSAHLFAGFKPIDRLVISPTLTYSELHRKDGRPLFHGWIGRIRTNLQLTRELFARFIVEYDEFGHDLDVEPLVTYRLNPFTLFYVGSSLGYHDYAPGGPVGPDETGLHPRTRQLFAKFQYLLRF